MVESDIEEKTTTTATGESVKDPPSSTSFVPDGRSSFKSKESKKSGMSRSASVSIMASVDRETLRSQLEELNDAYDNHGNGDQKRQSKLCFGVFCDLMKGVIIADIVYIVVAATNSYLLWDAYWKIKLNLELEESYDDDGFDDDEYLQQVQELEDLETQYKTILFKNCFGVVFSCLAIFGACKFQKWIVLSSFVWFCCDIASSFYLRRIVASLFVIIIAQPHFSLFRALSRNQMTPENYDATERYCCCTSNNERS